MRNIDRWEPTKYVERDGRWKGSRDLKQVARASRLVSDRAVGAYQDALEAFATGDLLDVACGEVPLYGIYRERVASTTCIDWTPSPYLDEVVDLRQPLPFGEAEFDTVLATDVLEHMPYPDQLFGEMRRVLRPGGVLIVGVPFLYWIHSAPHDHHRYTEYRLRLFCEDHDLTVEVCRPYGAGLDVLGDVVGKALASKRATRSLAGAPAGLLRKPRAEPASMPLGYILVATRT